MLEKLTFLKLLPKCRCVNNANYCVAIWPRGENLFTDKSKNKELIVAVDESERDMKLLTIYTE